MTNIHSKLRRMEEINKLIISTVLENDLLKIYGN